MVSESGTRGGSYSESFSYDNAGNSVVFRGVNQGFNADNQNTAYTYDGEGNPVVYKGVAMGYDEEDRLISVGSNWSAGYRGDGLRGWKQVNGSRVYYLYDGMNAVLEEDGSGKIVAEETFGLEGPLARSSGGRVLLYTPDGQGNVSQQVDAGSGNVVASYLFDGYGVRKVASGDPTAPQDPYSGYGGLAGYYTDWETGLCLLGFRYYDVASGRFLTRDPIGFEGGINLYEYVGNCPTMNQDSAGLVNWKCLINLPGWVTNLLMKCSTAIIKLIHHDKSAWCAVASACVLGTACSSIVKCTLSLQLANGTLIILSCIIWALCSLVGSVISEVCEAGGCPEKWWKWVEQNAICLIINAAVSCAVNVLGGILGGAIEVGGQKYDLPSWVRTYIMAHLAFLGFGINMTCSAAATGAAH